MSREQGPREAGMRPAANCRQTPTTGIRCGNTLVEATA